MITRFVPLALLCAIVSPGFAQDTPSAVPQQPVTPAPRGETVRVRLETSEGVIVLELEKARAPATTANFLRYVDQKRLDGTSFYRAMKAGDVGLIQGGARGEHRRVLPGIAHESTSVTGIRHLDGTISMARYAPGTATGDFFITIGAMPSLDADPSVQGDNAGFAAFGRVVEGMDVVRRILDAAISPTEGEGVMKGQMLASPVKIIAARRQEPQ